MSEQQTQHVPECIGIIVDGNRRWAKAQGLSVFKGHEAGYKNLKQFVIWARDAGVKHVIAYVFSTENWNRSEEEVTNLMNLARLAFTKELEAFKKEGVQLSIAGQHERLDQDIQKMVETVEGETKGMDRIHVVLALSYGGRAELIAAVQKLIDENETTVTEESFSEALWTVDTPDPDMIIRTGGARRLSNFLPWQSVYSELFFTDTPFPALTEKEFTQMLDEFAERERRHGK